MKKIILERYTTIMNKLYFLSNVYGKHQIFINSKHRLTEFYIKRYINPRSSVKIHIEGPRVLLDDLKEMIGVHIAVLLLTGGISVIGYLGFYLYEKWKPLYIVTLEVDNYHKNPLFELKIDDWDFQINP